MVSEERSRRPEVAMSFQAKRLRVQLPSGEAVGFVRPGEDGEPAADEKIIKGVCLDAASWVVGSCLDFFTQYILVAPAAIEFLDAEQLPALRERLAARLKEVEAAERALNERGSTGGD
jgi:hypothetical protein